MTSEVELKPAIDSAVSWPCYTDCLDRGRSHVSCMQICKFDRMKRKLVSETEFMPEKDQAVYCCGRDRYGRCDSYCKYKKRKSVFDQAFRRYCCSRDENGRCNGWCRDKKRKSVSEIDTKVPEIDGHGMMCCRYDQNGKCRRYCPIK